MNLYFTKKFNRERVRGVQCAFDTAERESKKYILVPVENRTKEILLRIIRERLRLCNRIINYVRAYRELINDKNFEYFFVIHEKNFVSPNDTTIHTQSI